MDSCLKKLELKVNFAQEQIGLEKNGKALI